MSIRTPSPLLLKNAWTIDRLPWPWPLAIAALLLGTATAVSAQTAPVEKKPNTEFPADALILAPQELQQRLEGKVHTGKPLDGPGWRLEYRGEYVFVNLSTGPSDKGRWRIEGSQLCTQYERLPSSCAEMRASATRLYLKRPATGEVVALEAAE
jgi:hypothetical protein